jgi:hypothetical protein
MAKTLQDSGRFSHLVLLLSRGQRLPAFWQLVF